MRSWLIGIVAVGFLTPLPRAASCIESIEIIPKQAALMYPLTRYTFAVRVRIPPHADHRLLELSWDGGPAGAGRSLRQLDEDAPITWTFPLRDLPGSTYVFVASVFDASGKRLGSDVTKTVLIGEDGGSQ